MTLNLGDRSAAQVAILPQLRYGALSLEDDGSAMNALVPANGKPLATDFRTPPAIVEQLGAGGCFAWDEFFSGMLPNEHTRTAYLRAVRRFLKWVEFQGVPLRKVTPGMIGEYFADHHGSPPTRKLHLSALRAFFNVLVQRHAIALNPAATVRTAKHQVVEGLTPEITVSQARQLLASIETNSMAGLRDRAILATLVYTAARVGAVANLKLKNLQHDGGQYLLRFAEKGGKSREIPVRSKLQECLLAYHYAACLDKTQETGPFFRTLAGKTDKLTGKAMSAIDICRMMKRRLKASSLPLRLSPHSFRVCAVSDLLKQGVPLEEVQFLCGHADPRTTRIYDRRQQTITRNIVERISI